MLLKVEPSNRADKKYKAVFSNGEVVHFGQKGADDYTTHLDKERKDRYIKRHKKEELFWNDAPYTPAALSRWITWEYPTIEEAIEMYNVRFFKKKKEKPLIRRLGDVMSMPTSDIHTVAFSKDRFTTKEAREWLNLHNLTPIKRVHKTVNTLRYRIRDPDLFSSFITKKNKDGINFVIGFYK